MLTAITHLVLRGGHGELPAVLPKVKEWGYEGVEVLFTDDGDINFGSTDADLAKVRKLFDEHGLQMTSMCPNHAKRGSLVSGKRADEDYYREHTAAAARACAKLGVDTLLIIPGGVTSSVPYDICYERAVRGLKSLRPIADETGVNLAVEYVWNDFFLSPLEVRAALDEVDHPQIGFYMDTGNMMAFSYPEQWIRILGRHVKKVHTKNFKRRPHWQWPNLLAEGDVDWDLVMAALKLIGYNGPLISEMSGSPEEHAENAKFTKALYGAA